MTMGYDKKINKEILFKQRSENGNWVALIG